MNDAAPGVVESNEETSSVAASIDGIVPIQSAITSAIEQIDQRYSGEVQFSNPTDQFHVLMDTITHSAFAVIAGRPNSGRTTLALQIARALDNNGKKVLFASSRLSTSLLGCRLLAMEAGLDAARLWSGAIAGDDWKGITHGVHALNDSNIAVFDERPLQIESLVARTRELAASGSDVDVIFVDAMTTTSDADQLRREVNMLCQLSLELSATTVVVTGCSSESEFRPNQLPIFRELYGEEIFDETADTVITVCQPRDGNAYINCAIERSPIRGSCELRLACANMSSAEGKAELSNSIVLPRLQGTKRQVEWATSIRSEIAHRHPEMKELQEKTLAAWWIQYREELLSVNAS